MSKTVEKNAKMWYNTSNVHWQSLPKGVELLNTDKKKLLFEFIRYCIVGGISAVVDLAVNYVFLYYVFGAGTQDTLLVVLSVAIGFAAGLVCNFVLSNLFVFTDKEQKEKGNTLSAFLIFAVVGLIGLLLTEVLTWAGTLVIPDTGIMYLLLSCFVKGVVLIWNYVGRKIFVYKGK